MENEKKQNEMSAIQELPDESLDAIAGGVNNRNVRFRFTVGNKVKFTLTDGSSEYLYGVIKYQYPKNFYGAIMAHYTITVIQDTDYTTYRDVPEHRIHRVL